MAKEECNGVAWELSLTSDHWVTAKVRVEVAEASLATKSTCLDESLAENAKLHLKLVEMRR